MSRAKFHAIRAIKRCLRGEHYKYFDNAHASFILAGVLSSVSLCHYGQDMILMMQHSGYFVGASGASYIFTKHPRLASPRHSGHRLDECTIGADDEMKIFLSALKST